MHDQSALAPVMGVGIALVDGDAAVRHARQIMLRSERYDVRSYATCAALLADPRSRKCPCIVVDVDSRDIDGVNLLREMRETGWRGQGILLNGITHGGALMREAESRGDQVFGRTIGDGPLLTAIAASINRMRADGTLTGDMLGPVKTG